MLGNAFASVNTGTYGAGIYVEANPGKDADLNGDGDKDDESVVFPGDSFDVKKGIENAVFTYEPKNL